MSKVPALKKLIFLSLSFCVVFSFFSFQKVRPKQKTSNIFELKIDFSKNSFLVWDGFNGYIAEHENNSSFQPQTYIINGNEITVEVAWPAGTAKEAKQMIDRGGNAGFKASDLLRDWIGTDGRKAKVDLQLTIKGVPAGNYEWKSYHHDYNDQTGVFNAEIKDATGSQSKKKVDISNGLLPLSSVTTLETMIKSDGSDIVFSFEMDSYPDNSSSFFVMNGFVLNEADSTKVPDPVVLNSPLNNLKYLRANTELIWGKSKFANNYNVFLGKEDPPSLYATVEQPRVTTSGLEGNTTYYWYVEAVNNNGSTKSVTRSFTTGDKNGSSFTGDLQLGFSRGRGFYNQSLELAITSNFAEANIVYTLDCSTPSIENGFVYSSPIPIDSTTVLKAVAISSDSVSTVTTESYIFPSSVAKQGKAPDGFPRLWGGKTVIPADYEMDPEIIRDSVYSSKFETALKSIPSLSLTMDVDDWFDFDTGLYVGYPNSNETREKAVSAEFLFNDKENFLVKCGVQNQGGTSIVNWKVPKQSMRLLFKEIYGPSRLHYKLFPDSEINSINTLVIDGLLYSWLHPWDDKQRVTSLYFRDQLASDMQNKMGGLSFHGIYIHLFINGLYWGVYNLHERPDDAFLARYLDAKREDFDVIKHNPNNVVSGSNNSYLMLLKQARYGFSSFEKLKKIENYLDLPAFIDYMILNFYLGNYDWAHQNYYAANNIATQSGFRFYTWDAEHVMRYSDVYYNNTQKNDKGGPTEIHTLLKQNIEYRMMFADAVYKHCFNNGALSPANFEKSFLFRANEIDDAIILESARWGDYLEKETGVTYTKNEYWDVEVNKVLESYIPQRRDIVISQLQDFKNNLFPKIMPPVFEIETHISPARKTVKLVNPNSAQGDIYYALNGSDPRKTGGSILGEKYNTPLEISKSTIVKARFLSKTTNEWSALAERTFLLDDVLGGSIVINEIMYHPENDYPEFIELINSGSEPINLNGFAFTDGIEFSFQTDLNVEPGGGVVLTNDTVLFESAYNYKAWAQYQKKLSNSGETIILRNGLNQVVDSVAYTDTIPWPTGADGTGYSLQLISPELNNALAASWKASDELFGSPINSKPATKPELEVQCYPNPFYNLITISVGNGNLIGNEFTIDVINELGSRVETINLNEITAPIQLNMAGHPPGIYFIQIKPIDNQGVKRVVFKVVKLK